MCLQAKGCQPAGAGKDKAGFYTESRGENGPATPRFRLPAYGTEAIHFSVLKPSGMWHFISVAAGSLCKVMTGLAYIGWQTASSKSVLLS